MKILIVFAALCIAVGAQAQVNSIGPTLGYNHAWLSDIDNGSARPSFNGGITFNHSILQSAGIGFEVRYSQEGAKTKIGGQTFTSELNYLRIPLKFVYYFGKLEDNFRPKIFAGPSFAFLIGGKSQTQVGGTTVSVNSKDNFESFDFGLQAGTGFNYRLAELVWLNFDVAYTHGFLNLTGDRNPVESKNRLVNANLGVAFGF